MIERDLAALDQREHEHRNHTLADRVGVHERVLGPGLRARGIAMAAKEIDDANAAELHAEARADFIELAEVRRERVAQRGEARIAVAEDRGFALDQDPSSAS
jgi:hypothetical protein